MSSPGEIFESKANTATLTPKEQEDEKKREELERDIKTISPDDMSAVRTLLTPALNAMGIQDKQLNQISFSGERHSKDIVITLRSDSLSKILKQHAAELAQAISGTDPDSYSATAQNVLKTSSIQFTYTGEVGDLLKGQNRGQAIAAKVAAQTKAKTPPADGQTR